MTQQLSKEELSKTQRKRAFLFTLAELQKHKDIADEKATSLINHPALSPMILSGIMGWVESKKDSFTIQSAELTQLFRDSRKKIHDIKDEFEEHNEVTLSSDAKVTLDEMDSMLEEMLDNSTSVRIGE
jgi:ERCC4-type nuclease